MGLTSNVNILGYHDTQIHCGGQTFTACFYVSDLSNNSLLRFTTSKGLCIIKLGHIRLVEGSLRNPTVQDYADRFPGLGNGSGGPARLHCERMRNRAIIVSCSCNVPKLRLIYGNHSRMMSQNHVRVNQCRECHQSVLFQSWNAQAKWVFCGYARAQ